MLECATDVEARRTRHHDIEENDVRLFRDNHIERFASIRGDRNVEAGDLEKPRKRATSHLVVVDDQHTTS